MKNNENKFYNPTVQDIEDDLVYFRKTHNSIEYLSYETLLKRHSEISKNKDLKSGWDNSTKLNLAKLTRIYSNTSFIGYETLNCTATVIAIIYQNKLEETLTLGKDDDISLILDKTTLYPESGGQSSDFGLITINDAIISIHNSEKTQEGFIIHSGKVIKPGLIAVGNIAQVDVESTIRNQNSQNHTVTHLLQDAIKNIIDSNASQKGSFITSEYLRFDFNCSTKPSDEQLSAVEKSINESIKHNYEVLTNISKFVDIKKEKNIRMNFGDKYGDVVRVVDIKGTTAIELCGGTHVKNLKSIECFKIIKCQLKSKGIYRIKAITGFSKVYDSLEIPFFLTTIIDLESLKDKSAHDLLKKHQDDINTIKLCTNLDSFSKNASNIILSINALVEHNFINKAKNLLKNNVATENTAQINLKDYKMISINDYVDFINVDDKDDLNILINLADQYALQFQKILILTNRSNFLVIVNPTKLNKVLNIQNFLKEEVGFKGGGPLNLIKGKVERKISEEIFSGLKDE